MILTLRSLADQFFACITVTNAPGTVAYYRRHVERFLEHVGEIPISELKPPALIAWGRSWHQVQAVQRLFNWAVNEAGLLEQSPFRRVKRPRLGRRKRTLQRGQVVELLRRAGPRFRAYLLALRETIARPQEIRALTWEDLHAVDGQGDAIAALAQGGAFFVLHKHKAQALAADPDRPRILLISPRLGRLLARLASVRCSAQGPIFLRDDGAAWTNNAVRLRMRRLRRRCGLHPDARGENIVCYTFRHTGATRATSLGVRDRQLAELMGHTTTRMTARYQHLETAHLREAFDKLNPDRRKSQ